MRIPLVDLKAQYASIEHEIKEAIHDVLDRTAFIGGADVQSFEEEFASFCQARHCIGVGNGTDALWITLRSLGIGAGDEVIVPANSFVATSEAVTMTGARVVFADILAHSYNIDPDSVARKINERTRAIIPVHLYGQPADLDPLLGLARRYDLKVIEDAAQAHGAEYKGRRVGTVGDAACFSFYPGKNLGAYGDAGAIVTNDDVLAKRARMFANHGRVDKYVHQIEGVNSRLDALQAAILSAKLKHLEEWTQKRRQLAYHYNQCFQDTPIQTPSEIEMVRSVYHLYVVRVPPQLRDRVQQRLGQQGVATGIHYPIALPDLPAYDHLSAEERDCPRASSAAKEILSLPMYAELDHADAQHIARLLVESVTEVQPVTAREC